MNPYSENSSGSDYWRYAGIIPGAPPPDARLRGFSKTSVAHCSVPGLGDCLFKMEQTCPTGSHKDRAAIFQVSLARHHGAAGVIIPSSGNAAIAVAAAGAEGGLPVFAFLSPRTHPGKLAAAALHRPHLIICSNPVNRARNAARRFGMPNLRPSIDENAVKGFMTLGYELGDLYTREPFSSLFIFSTSGATLTGIARALNDLHRKGRISNIPQLHAVQAGKASGIASRFDESPACIAGNGRSPGFGGVSNSRLYPELLMHIRSSGGAGWLTGDNDAECMHNLLTGLEIQTSPEGCCALAAAIRWRRAGGTGTPLVVLTGTRYPDTLPDPDLGNCPVCRARTYGEIEQFMRKWSRP